MYYISPRDERNSWPIVSFLLALSTPATIRQGNKDEGFSQRIGHLVVARNYLATGATSVQLSLLLHPRVWILAHSWPHEAKHVLKNIQEKRFSRSMLLSVNHADMGEWLESWSLNWEALWFDTRVAQQTSPSKACWRPLPCYSAVNSS